MTKTNAVRLLDSLQVSYELRTYDVDPNDLAAETVAAKIGLPPEQVFKTLLAPNRNPCLVFRNRPVERKLSCRK